MKSTKPNQTLMQVFAEEAKKHLDKRKPLAYLHTMTTTSSQTTVKETLFCTAKAAVSCAAFNAGEWVGIKFYHFGDNGEAWYLVTGTERGQLDFPIAYPSKHFSQFGL